MSYTSHPIYTNNDMAIQWPAMVKTADGTFHVFFNKKIGPNPNDNGLCTSESTDNGQTWSTPVQIATSTESSDVKIDACVAGDGVQIFVTVPGDNGGKVYRGSGGSYSQVTTYFNNIWANISVSGNYVYLIDNPIFSGNYYLRVQYSSNNGASFSETLPFIGSQILGYAIASNGLEVYLVYTMDSGSSYEMRSFKSTDGGSSFIGNITVDSPVVAAGSSGRYQNVDLCYDDGKLYLAYLKGTSINNVTGLYFGTSTDGLTYSSLQITGIPLPSGYQCELKIIVSGSTIYITYLDSNGNIQLLTSTSGGNPFAITEVSPTQSPNDQYQCGFELGSIYILYTIITGGIPSLYITSNFVPIPPVYMCFHPDSIITLKNGEDVQIGNLKAGDQLVGSENQILTVIKLITQPTVGNYYQIEENVFVTENHLVKTPDNRTRLAKASKSKLVKKTTHDYDYHILTNGSHASHFVLMKNGYFVEVLGLSHPFSKKLQLNGKL